MGQEDEEAGTATYVMCSSFWDTFVYYWVGAGTDAIIDVDENSKKNKDDSEKQLFDSIMDEVPDEVVSHILGYLPAKDALQLSSTSKKLNSRLSLTPSPPRTIINKFVRRDHDNRAHYGFGIPVPKEVACHSISISMLCEDEGWPIHKGKLYVVAEESGKSYDKSGGQHFLGGGRIIHTSSNVLVLLEEMAKWVTYVAEMAYVTD